MLRPKMMNLTKRFKRLTQLLPSTNEVAEGNAFGRVCLFTGGGGVTCDQYQ